MEKKEQRLLNISVRSFATALIILFLLMLLTYALTFLLPAGQYERAEIDGREAIVAGTYHAIEGGLPVWKFLLSPILVLFAEGGTTAIIIILFLLIVGGAFTALDASGVMRYLLSRIHHAFERRRYMLLLIVTLFFMALGACIGSYEECVPLVPLVVALSYSLGWDALVGLGASILAAGCGFSTGVCNPFTIGVAQQLASLPMFSGIWFRLLGFVIVYAILACFIVLYARRLDQNPARSLVYDPDGAEKWKALRVGFERNDKLERAVRWFGVILGTGILLIVLSGFIPFLQDAIMPIIAAVFLIAGVASSLAAGMPLRRFLGEFGNGVKSMLPAVLLILMASAVRYTLSEAGILDTILYGIVSLTETASPRVVVLLIYALVLVMNFFIASGSAKAFLLMPLILPVADLYGISRQIAILAFAFGDGFSNVFYPTNPVLLISLGIAGVSYGKWARWTAPLQILLLVITCALLLFALAIGY